MGWAKTVAIFIIFMMSILAINIVLHDSMAHGVGFDTFMKGSGSPWQMFINQDLVSGLLLTMSWIIYRQRGSRVLDTAAWLLLVLWWGNIVVSAYVLLAAYQSRGDAEQFFIGARAARPMRAAWTSPPVLLRLACLAGAVISALYLARALILVHFAWTSTVGYIFGFVPIALAFLLLTLPTRGKAGRV